MSTLEPHKVAEGWASRWTRLAVELVLRRPEAFLGLAAVSALPAHVVANYAGVIPKGWCILVFFVFTLVQMWAVFCVSRSADTHGSIKDSLRHTAHSMTRLIAVLFVRVLVIYVFVVSLYGLADLAGSAASATASGSPPPNLTGAGTATLLGFLCLTITTGCVPKIYLAWRFGYRFGVGRYYDRLIAKDVALNFRIYSKLIPLLWVGLNLGGAVALVYIPAWGWLLAIPVQIAVSVYSYLFMREVYEGRREHHAPVAQRVGRYDKSPMPGVATRVTQC